MSLYFLFIIRIFHFIIPLCIGFFINIKYTNASPLLFQKNTENSPTPHHLIIGIDGVPYTSFLKAQENGLFQNFKEPSRMISTFPSLTKTAWSIMLQNSKHNGYQPTYYQSNLKRKLINSNKYASFNEIPKKIPKGKKTMFPRLSYTRRADKVFRKQLSSFQKTFLENPLSQGYFILFSITDKVLHTKGEQKLMELLHDLDRTITDLRRQYNQIYGEPLAITLVSDHGNTLLRSKRDQLHKVLKKAGFQIVKRLESSSDIVDTSYGIVSVAPLYMKEERKKEVFEISAKQTEYVDLVITRLKNGGYLIGRESHRLEFYSTEDRKFFFLTKNSGDLLGLETQGIKTQRWISQEEIFQASINTAYPDSLHRIVEGFNDVNHLATILVTFKEGYEHASTLFFKFIEYFFKNRAGTHGGLQTQESHGILVSTQYTFPPYIPARNIMNYIDPTFYYPDITLHIEPKGELIIRFENRKLPKEIHSIDIEILGFNFQHKTYRDLILKETVNLLEEKNTYLDWISPILLQPGHHYEISLRGLDIKGNSITKIKKYRMTIRGYIINIPLTFP